MSNTIICTRDVRNRAILESSLQEHKIVPTQVKEDVFTWGHGYSKTSIDLKTGNFTFDEMHKREIDALCKTYSKNLVRSNIIKKGHKIKSQKVLADGRIEIIANY